MVASPSRRTFGAGLAALACTAAAPGAVDVRSFGAVGDGRDDTAALLRAHASGRPLIYPRTAGAFRTTATLPVRADVIGRGGALRIDGNGKSERTLFSVGAESPGVSISGMVLDGGYAGGSAGEWSHLIALISARAVTIRNNVLRRPYGDCVYIGAANTSHAPSRDIIVSGNVMDSPRRCAVAVISADGVLIDSNDITWPHGYVAAVDLEPNWAPDRVQHVRIRRNRFGAAGPFIRVTGAGGGPATDVIVEHNRGRAAIFFQAYGVAHLTRGAVRENDFVCTDPAKGGLIRADKGADLVLSRNRDNTRAARYSSVRLDGAA